MIALPHLMPTYGEATALSGMLSLINVTTTAVRKYRSITWSGLLPILLTFLVVSFFAVKCVANIDSQSIKRVLGVVLVAISIYFFYFSGKIHVRPSIPVQAGLGTLSGLMGGFFAMQGPPAVIYFLSSSDSKEQYIAHISAYYVIGNLMMTLFRASSGFVTGNVLTAWLIAFPAVIAGYIIGKKIYDRMPIGTLRKAVYALMAVSGVVTLIIS